jgi:hypothetical protein
LFICAKHLFVAAKKGPENRDAPGRSQGAQSIAKSLKTRGVFAEKPWSRKSAADLDTPPVRLVQAGTIVRASELPPPPAHLSAAMQT